MQLLERIGLWARRWACYVRVRKELETYSERELADMGMTRSDIGRIALEAAALVEPEASEANRAGPGKAALGRPYPSPYL